MKLRERSGTGQLVELVVIVAIALGLALGIQAFLIKPYRIPSGSMLPTLHINQRVLVNRIGHVFNHPSVGDIVVFHPPVGADRCARPAPSGAACDAPVLKEDSVYFIKRVVGGPGDVIQIRNGHVIRDGRPEADGYINPCGFNASPCDFRTPIRIPPGMYFMMGDNRGDSQDSRFWGPVPNSWIIGKAFATYWPPDRIGLL